MPGNRTKDSLVTTDFKAVELDEPVSRVLGYLRGETADTPIITERGNFAGLLNVQGVMRSALHDNEHVGKYVLTGGGATRATTPREAATMLERAGTEALAVVERQKPVGVMHALNVARALGVNGVNARIALAEVPMLFEHGNAGDAMKGFRGTAAWRLPVINDANVIVGFVARTEIVKLETMPRRSDQHHFKETGTKHALELPLAELVDRSWPRVQANASAEAAIDLAAEWGVAPVEEGGVTIGMATPRSLVHAVASQASAAQRT